MLLFKQKIPDIIPQQRISQLRFTAIWAEAESLCESKFTNVNEFVDVALRKKVRPFANVAAKCNDINEGLPTRWSYESFNNNHHFNHDAAFITSVSTYKKIIKKMTQFFSGKAANECQELANNSVNNFISPC